MFVLVVDVIMIMRFRLVVEYHYKYMMIRLMVGIGQYCIEYVDQVDGGGQHSIDYDHAQVDGGLPPDPALLLQPPLPPVDQVLLHSWRALRLPHATALL